MRIPVIRLKKSGSLVALEDPTTAAENILAAELTYDFVRYLRGPEARFAHSKIQIIPTYCFKCTRDPDGIFAPRILFPAGYLDRVARAFKTKGYRVLLRDDQTKTRHHAARWDRVKPAVKFRYRQKETLEKIIAARCGGQVICPCGWGKSLLIRCLCQALPQAKIDISTHSLDVLDQLYWDISACIPGVAIDSSSRKREGGGRITLYAGKSIHHSRGDADILIVDELHEWATADYIRRLARYRNARRFGFTASPERKDGAHFELEGAFGPRLVTVTYQEAVDHGCIVPIAVNMVDVIMDENPAEGYEDTAKERWGIWRNKVRNTLIAEQAHALGDDEQTLITVKTFEHAAFLKKQLPEFELCYSENIDADDFRRFVSWGLLPKNEPMMDRDRRQSLKRRFEQGQLKKVIATTVWNRGVNFQDLAVLIRADASDSMIADTQIPGRTARLPDLTDKKYGRVIDFLDQFDQGFKRKASSRVGRYRDNEWAVYMPERLQRLQKAAGLYQKTLF